MHLYGERNGVKMFKGKFRVTAGCVGWGGVSQGGKFGLERGKEVSLILEEQGEAGDKVWFMG